MANLTITVDDGVLQRARVRAVQQHTSVNAILRDYLEMFASAPEAAARARLIEMSRDSMSGSAGDRSWTREDAHER